MVIATNRPGFYQAQEAALAGTGGGMLLEDYIQLRRTRRKLPALSGVWLAWSAFSISCGQAEAELSV